MKHPFPAIFFRVIIVVFVFPLFQTSWFFFVSEHLGKQLEDYIAPYKKIKIVRTKQREGLIRARLLGYSVAKGDVVTFLDSHCECAVGEKLSLFKTGKL